VRCAPAHPLPSQDAPDLAAAERKAVGLGGSRQRIQAPVGGPFRVSDPHPSIGVRDQPCGRRLPDQGHEPTVLLSRQATGTARARLIAHPIDPRGIEAMQAPAHGLGTAVQRGCHRLHPLAIPPADHHRRMLDPIRRPMTARGTLTHQGRFLRVLCGAHAQDFGHPHAPLAC
jgi:hypothetical protein